MTYDCARCGVDAYPYGIRAINRDGRVLDLCGHHATEHDEALKKQGWTVVTMVAVAEAAALVPAVEVAP